MSPRLPRLTRLWPCLVGLVCAGFAAPAQAGQTYFRNECPGAVVVQAVSVVRGVVLRSRPLLLMPGMTSNPGLVLIGNKVVTVNDAKVPAKVILRDAVPAAPGNLYYSIRPPNPLLPLGDPRKTNFHLQLHPVIPPWAPPILPGR